MPLQGESHMMRRNYAAGAAGMALLIAFTGIERPAHAQNLALEEIVVTARKREEKLTEIPLSITAFSAADIEKKALEIALECLDAMFPAEHYFTSKQVLTALSGPPPAHAEHIDMAEFRDALRIVLGTAPGNLRPVEFGHAWTKLRGRPVGGLVMKLARDGNEGKVYKLVRITSK